MRSKRTKALILGVVVAGAAAVPALAHGGEEAADDSEVDTPITGPDLKTASQAALDHLGGGRVTGTEIEDEESYYEIEVTTDDGRQVDVQLDEGFQVVGTEDDGRGPDD